MTTQDKKKTGRNTPCPCGSGKKYKKCCLSQNEAESTNNILSELQYNITDKPLKNHDIDKLPTDVQEEIDTLYHQLNNNPASTIKNLENLVQRYANIPQLYNYLYAAYINTGQIEKGNRVLQKNYQKNPSYLFAKLNYAEYLMSIDKLDKVAFTKVFDNKFDLALIYPERDVFHTSEVVNFYGVMGHFYLLTKQVDKAQYCVDILQKLSPTHEYTARLIKEINLQARCLP